MLWIASTIDVSLVVVLTIFEIDKQTYQAKHKRESGEIISMNMNIEKQFPPAVVSSSLASPEMRVSQSAGVEDKPSFLPEGFIPQKKHVICGRGKKVFEHPGNENYRFMVLDRVAKYKAAPTKAQKSAVVSSVFDDVTKEGAFVKEDPLTSRWYVPDDQGVREKISQFFRDCLADRYKSSKKVVAAKRRKRVSLDNSLLSPDLVNSRGPMAPVSNKKRRVSFSSAIKPSRRTSTDAFRELLLFSQQVMDCSEGEASSSTCLPTLADSRKHFKAFLEAPDSLDAPVPCDAYSLFQDDETIAPDCLSVVDTEMIFSPKSCFAACVH